MRGGKLYVSPNYLCFGTHFPRILVRACAIVVCVRVCACAM
jgi:hypothetical protein